MYLIRVYNESTRYLYSSTFQSTCTCTQVLLKIQYLYLYLYSSIFQVLVLVLEYFCPVLAPSLPLPENLQSNTVGYLRQMCYCPKKYSQVNIYFQLNILPTLLYFYAKDKLRIINCQHIYQWKGLKKMFRHSLNTNRAL